ncbi:beta strand repeat-containing protein [Giesbergeria anulus]|uniref:Uncharacterized protein n=1 Tax=Giesbergeria anulus TaxID=180197 RepID=A0A1H9L801_9BURK|nr:hypothetical protein [Giesbergeria anulus]SER07554.1 hypothetical protein SAMN02982919_01692 [Giesbergeria anulus]
MPQTIFGAQAVVSSLNRAFNDASPANAIFQNQVTAAGATQASQFAFANQFGASFNGSSDTALATQVLTNMGVLPSTNATVQELVPALAEYFGSVGLENRGTVVLQLAQILSSLETATGNLAVYNTAAAAWNQEVAASFIQSTGGTTGESTTELGLGRDHLTGTAGADIFTAPIINNSNTLQSGDKIDASGAGVDRLQADIGTSQNFAITPETTGVEQVAIRAQAISKDSTDNNTASTSEVQIDAERMKGVTQWESNNSRADVLIEDVRIAANQITKDITIAMVETDPGHVDFGVYFDQYSLRAQTNTSSNLVLELLDTRSQAAGTGPLKDSPYNAFAFNLTAPGATTPTNIVVQSEAINTATTYVELRDAIAAAVAAKPELAGFNVALGNTFTRFDTISGQPVTGTQIVLSTNTGATVSAEGANTGWSATGPVPASSGLHTAISNSTANNTDLVTSKVILDDVGRGSTGGDLVIGGLSVGDTSHSMGVERFEIEVRDNSKLQTINSTNNTLREVSIKNGVTSSNSFAYVSTEQNKGDLTVNGNVAFTLGNSNVDNNVAPTAVSATGSATGYGLGIDTALPGSATQHNAYGFSDVRLIDGSTFAGDLAFTAEVTARSIAKYMNLVDTQANPVETNVAGSGLNNFGTGAIANFNYTTGAGNDKLVVDLDGAVVASRSLVVAGREDFTFNVDGGAGNDNITVKLINNDIVGGVRNNAGNTQNWYNNQDLNNNVTVSGGAGNDTIWTPGAGDVKIDAGTGNDTVYTDNTGFQTVATAGATGYNGNATSYVKGQWVFNTVDQTTAFGAAPAAGLYGASGRNINDLRSDSNETFNFYNSKLVVSFKGIPSTTVVVGGTGYKTSDLQINQAIKSAINNDAVLSKLLVAEDGPANSLVVKSLIDGAVTTADLGVTLTPLTATEVGALSAVELAAVGAAYGITAPTAASVSAAIAAAYTTFTGFGDYVTALANDGTANITGNASLSTSDNLVLPGEGNDVIVLGTTVGTTAAGSSNDTVVIGNSFGNDTVVNFAATGNGADAFDFTALKGTTLTAGYTTDKSIAIQAATTLGTSSTVTEKAAIEALFNANNAAAQDHVFLSVNAHNVASVYTVADAAGATNAVATLQGTIDLGDTAWGTLTAANFVNSSAANYNLSNGPTGLNGSAGTTPVTPGTGTAATVAVTAAGSVTETAATNTTFNVAAGNYTYNIAGFGAGDKLAFPTAGLATIVNADFTDGIVDVQYATGGTTTVIHLTGVPAATDAAIFGVTSFNAAFGAGTLA